MCEWFNEKKLKNNLDVACYDEIGNKMKQMSYEKKAKGRFFLCYVRESY